MQMSMVGQNFGRGYCEDNMLWWDKSLIWYDEVWLKVIAPLHHRSGQVPQFGVEQGCTLAGIR